MLDGIAMIMRPCFKREPQHRPSMGSLASNLRSVILPAADDTLPHPHLCEKPPQAQVLPETAINLDVHQVEGVADVRGNLDTIRSDMSTCIAPRDSPVRPDFLGSSAQPILHEKSKEVPAVGFASSLVSQDISLTWVSRGFNENTQSNRFQRQMVNRGPTTDLITNIQKSLLSMRPLRFGQYRKTKPHPCNKCVSRLLVNWRRSLQTTVRGS